MRPHWDSTIPSSLYIQPIMPSLLCCLLQKYFTYMQLYESQWGDNKWDLKLSRALLTRLPLKREMFQIGLPCYLGLNSGRSVSINVNKMRKNFSRNIHGVRMIPQCFPVSHTGNIVSSVSFLFLRCKLCLRYKAGNFNKNPSMHASTLKILGAPASEQSSNF